MNREEFLRGLENALSGNVPLDEVLEDCLDRVSGLAVKKGIQVQIASYEEEEAVLGDGELICKVLENFLTNALRYAISEVTMRIRPEKKTDCNFCGR